MTSKITISKTEDQPYIESVFLNPTIYAEMKDDSCPSEPSLLAGADIRSIPGFFLKVMVGDIPAGAFWLIWKDDAVEAHTALLQNCRGRLAVEATKKAIDWVFSNTAAKAITSYAWSDSPLASWLCRAVNMRKGETKAWPSKRNGKAVDITYYAIQREGI